METKSAPKRAAMDAALFYLGIRDRSVGEMKEYLQKKQYGQEEIETVLARLDELKLVDDSAFARNLLRSKTAVKAISRKEMKSVLIRHKIPKQVAEETLSEFDADMELDAARRYALEAARKVAKYPREEQWKRAAAKMAAKGFPYGVIREALMDVLDRADGGEEEYTE